MKKILGFLSLTALLSLTLIQVPAFSEDNLDLNTSPGGSNSGGTAANMPSMIAVAHGSQGDYLTGTQGMTLYVFSKDTQGKSMCTDQCAQKWMPMIASNVQNIQVSAGVDRSLLGTIARTDGNTQVTYKGMPLYYYSGDQKPGDTNGQNMSDFGGTWNLVTPTGTAVTGGGESGTSGNTGTTGNPGSTGNPSTPGAPGNPGNPSTPSNPSNPSTPGAPGSAGNPNTSGNPSSSGHTS